MQQVIYEGKLYEVYDMTERCYLVYDISGTGHTLYLPKEECEVV